MSTSDKTFDIITLGPSFVDFYGEQKGASLKEMLTFKKSVGGFAPNISIGCARLKIKSALVSALGSDPMGQFVLETLQHEKVDTRCIHIDTQKPTTMSLRNIPSQGEVSTVFYKENCAGFSYESQEVNPAFIAKARALVVCSMNATATKAIRAAHESRVKVILVLDPSMEVDKSTVTAVLPFCDLIIGAVDELTKITAEHNIAEALKTLQSLTHAKLIVATSEGLEGFVAGYLKGWLQGERTEDCEKIALACQNVAQLQPGHNAFATSAALSLYITEQQQNKNGQPSSFFTHVHHGSSRYRQRPNVYSITLGQHAYWSKLKAAFQVDESLIQQAKKLITKGIQLATQNIPDAGIVIEELSASHLIDSFSTDHWIARTLEVPGEVPLQFQGDPDITHALSQWPKHHVAKVSVIYHPDDRYTIRGQQEASLRFLYRACRNTEHELLVDIAPPTNSLITASTIAHIMNRFYEIGIYPDWWQIPAPRDTRTWDSVQRVIEEKDPYCQGVIMLAQLATFEQMPLLFQSAAKQKHCKGFVVGRAIYQAPVEKWLSKKIDDVVLIEQVAKYFQYAVQLWEDVKVVNPVENA
jgi:5-dehydro-2-deoxygluconokinase